MPVAVNCWDIALGMDGLTGATEIEVSTADVTVSVVFPEIVPDVAVIVEIPKATPVARPLVLTVAAAVEPEIQDTNALTSYDVPSE